MTFSFYFCIYRSAYSAIFLVMQVRKMQELFTAESVKLKKSEKKLSTFLGQTGNLPDSTRVWVNGFGRSTAQRAVWANKKLLQILDDDDIINLDDIMKGYNKYIQKYPNSNFNYYMVDYKVKKLGYKKGVALPAIPKNAAVLSDSSSKHDPYHIMNRMTERQITDDDLRAFMNDSKVMFAQWNGQRQAFYSSTGVVVIAKTPDGWIFKTSFSKPDFDEETEKILEVIHKYVKG